MDIYISNDHDFSVIAQPLNQMVWYLIKECSNAHIFLTLGGLYIPIMVIIYPMYC